jgi:predicted Zn-ribbon and HTH transcriptional regulator
MKLIKPKCYNPGDKTVIEAEPKIDNISFNLFKYNLKNKPENKKDILIICCFSEFGCEVTGALYAFNLIKNKYPNKYYIVVGWHGREYIYRHLVDEFWEIKEEHMWLREYARAFHNDSKNLKNVEHQLKEFGEVFTSADMGKIITAVSCNNCSKMFGTVNRVEKCSHCGSSNINQSVFGDVIGHKKHAIRIPCPSDSKMETAKAYLGNNPVGIFARSRKCYGRNLTADFYVKLINTLKSMNYTPIWLGEKQSVLECPVDDIIDFSRMKEARDLELTLSIVKQLKFTIQFWTASSRLSAIMGTPYILFESPDQIWGSGQEGYRLNLTTFGPKKLVISHYLNALDNPDLTIDFVKKSIKELNDGNYNEMFALLDNEQAVINLKKANDKRIGNL